MSRDWESTIVHTFVVGSGEIAVHTLRGEHDGLPAGVLVSTASPGHHFAGEDVPDDYQILGPSVAFRLDGPDGKSVAAGLKVLADVFARLAEEVSPGVEQRESNK